MYTHLEFSTDLKELGHISKWGSLGSYLETEYVKRPYPAAWYGVFNIILGSEKYKNIFGCTDVTAYVNECLARVDAKKCLTCTS